MPLLSQQASTSDHSRELKGLRPMKSYICGFWRVLIIEGDDCHLVLIDTYSKGSNGRKVIEAPEVSVIQSEKSIGRSVGDGKETIYEVRCVDKVNVEEVLDYVKEKYGVHEGCIEE